MRAWLQRVKCFFGFHHLVVSEEEQKRLEEAMKNPMAVLFGVDRLSDGSKIIFQKCLRCGVLK